VVAAAVVVVVAAAAVALVARSGGGVAGAAAAAAAHGAVRREARPLYHLRKVPVCDMNRVQQARSFCSQGGEWPTNGSWQCRQRDGICAG
jgi:hypothetical protein